MIKILKIDSENGLSRKFSHFLVLTLLVSISAFAAENPGKPSGPCQQIAQICKNAGFVAGDWKNGDGLWRDCVDPIVQGSATVPGAKKPLPTVDPTLVAACKLKNPKFGVGKVGGK